MRKGLRRGGGNGRLVRYDPKLVRNGEGKFANLTGLCREFPEVTWHTLEQWARAQDWSVL